MSHSLIVLPDDSALPIVEAIGNARGEISIAMFVFDDPAMREAVLAAHRRDVAVRVILNQARRDGRAQNDPTRAALAAAGIEVREGNPAFDLTHAKALIVDRAVGIVQSFNWSP